jgi:hypothetical protein
MKLVVETSTGLADAVQEAKGEIDETLRATLIAREETDQQIMLGMDSDEKVPQPAVST